MPGSPTYELYFGVKYYVPDPTHLREELTRYHYCLQVRPLSHCTHPLCVCVRTLFVCSKVSPSPSNPLTSSSFQVCQDVRENRVLFTREVVQELLVLLIQASSGDYDPADHPPGYTDEFLKFLYTNTEALVCGQVWS